MRKKKLFAQIESVVQKSNELYEDNLALSKEVERQKVLIAELEEKLKSAEQEIETLKNSDANEPRCDDVQSVLIEDTEKDIEIIAKKPTSVSDERDDVTNVDRAASIIGEVVKLCAEACNFFTEKGGINAKDLVNLALGRTEVFKSEMLEIVSNHDDITEVQSQIDTLKRSVIDYFELLKGQI